MAQTHITRRVLTREVSYTGRTPLGWKSTITFTPTDKRGWWWNTGRDIVPIDHRILRLRKRRLVLVHGKAEFHVPEHIIGPLRYLGFDSIVISCSRSWPPYDARPYEVWEKLIPFMHEDGIIPFKGITSNGQGGNGVGFTIFTQVSDRPANGLEVRIDVDYPGIGAGSLVWHSSQQKELAWFLKAPAPVYSRRLYPLVPIIKELARIWPHRSKVSWPRAHRKKLWVKNALRHRLVDLLGAFGLVFHEELPHGFIHSDKAGHACDFGAIRSFLRNRSGT